MKEKYYNLPIRFDTLTRKNQVHPECDLKKSIAQHIVLIITSKFQEHRFNEQYGCELWDTDFELITDNNKWKERVRKSIQYSLNHFEKRLVNIVVDTELTEEEIQVNQTVSVKKQLMTNVNATIDKTGEPFYFRIKLYISPLSLN